MTVLISKIVLESLQSFNQCVKEIRNLRGARVDEQTVRAWEDELGRLRIWAANIGAHQIGQSSLDFRLRDASHIRDQVLKLLRGLAQRLRDASDMLVRIRDERLAKGSTSEEGPINEEDPEDKEEPANTPDPMDQEGLMEEEDPKSEFLYLRKSVATIINCLFQMSILIRRPARHDLHLRSLQIDVSPFESYDYNHVRDKFPKANETIVKRLGAAITQRRKYLKYRETHAAKLKQGLHPVDEKHQDGQNVYKHEAIEANRSSRLSETVATELENKNIDLNNITFNDNASETEVSQTSYASTIINRGPITIPLPPRESIGGAPFVCPHCFYIITIKSTHSWHKHIFQDLQPYICIAETCVTPNRLYSTRREWLHHVKLCSTSRSEDCKLGTEAGVLKCSLCEDPVESGKKHDRHLARHLQELALYILPRDAEESDLDQNMKSNSSTENDDHEENQNKTNSLNDSSDPPVNKDASVDDQLSRISNQLSLDLEELLLGSKQGDERLSYVLMKASEIGDTNSVATLITAGANVNAQNDMYGNALQLASCKGHEEVVRLLLNAGANVNAQGGQYGNALVAASFGGLENAMQLLLNADADVNVQGGLYGNAYEHIVQLLLHAGADVNAQNEKYGNALIGASFLGHENVVRLFLNAGANVNAQSEKCGNALIAASFHGNENVVRVLLDAGAHVNAQWGEYGNALQAASYWGYEGIIKLLLNAGADVTAQNGRYGNALQAASRGGHESAVRLLLNAGAIQREGYDDAALMTTLLEWRENVEKAKADDPKEEYSSELISASYWGHENKVLLLLNKGVNINASSGYFGNALHVASLMGHENLVKLLLDAGANVNAQGGKYSNALMAASIMGHENVVRLLLGAGANANVQGKVFVNPESGYYRNALEAACREGHENVVKLLLDAGAISGLQEGET